MKKLIVIAIAIIAILTMTVPAMAAPDTGSATTGVTVTGGSADGPIILAKWETTGTAANSEDDAGHLVPGTQVLPNITLYDDGDTTPTCDATVYFWALVMGPGSAFHDIGQVDAYVYEPNDFIGATLPYEPPKVTADGAYDDSQEYAYKDKVVLHLLYDTTGDDQVAEDAIAAALSSANASGLLTVNPDYTLEQILTSYILTQGHCELWRGSFVITHPQAGGIYWVNAFALTESDPVTTGVALENCFDYLRVAALDKDFDAIDWGSIGTSSNAEICGDYTLAPEADGSPTVKSGGNCALDVTVLFSNMLNGEGMPIQRVQFDAFLFSDAHNVCEPVPAESPGNPPPRTVLDISHSPNPGTHLWLPICTPTKIGFSIHVYQAAAGTYSGTVTITATDNGIPWAGELCDNEPACANS